MKEGHNKTHTYDPECPFCESERKRPRRVYVAGAYSSDNVLGVLNNIREGIKVSAAVLKAGHSPFCPWADHLFHLQDGTLTVEQYQQSSMSWLEVSDVVLLVPGWENSKGTRKEIARATELGIPVVEHLLDIEKGERDA